MTKPLHIIHAGIENGDQRWIETAAKSGDTSTPTWVAPKSATTGDDAVIYIGSLGFFATARIASTPKPRKDWKNRFGAALDTIQLIQPPLSLGVIQRKIPDLQWALYPRSITSPSAQIAEQIRSLIQSRRRHKGVDLEQESLATANLAELRAAAIAKSRPTAPARERERIERLRSSAIHLYVLARAGGHCEGCAHSAPFVRADNKPYLEPHHTGRLADDGPDHPSHVIALCPNCHRRAHYGKDAVAFNKGLKRTLAKLERG